MRVVTRSLRTTRNLNEGRTFNHLSEGAPMIRTLTTALVLATATAAFADGDFDRTLTVSSQPDLYVSTGSGSIRISPGSDSQIHVKAHLHAGWNGGEDLDGRIRQIIANPPIRQEGNTVRVGQTNDRRLFN